MERLADASFTVRGASCVGPAGQGARAKPMIGIGWNLDQMTRNQGEKKYEKKEKGVVRPIGEEGTDRAVGRTGCALYIS